MGSRAQVKATPSPAPQSALSSKPEQEEPGGGDGGRGNAPRRRAPEVGRRAPLPGNARRGQGDSRLQVARAQPVKAHRGGGRG